MFVIPTQGIVIRDPDTRQPIPAEGREVPKNAFWVRRLRDGDVREAAPAPAAQQKPAKDGENK